MAKIDFESGSSKFAPAFSRTEWLEWCWTHNHRAQEKGWHHWIYVRDVDHGSGPAVEIATLDGDEVADIWALMQDKPYVPYKWDAAQVRKHFGLVQWRLERGVSPDFFMLWSAENRRNRRSAIIEREVSFSVRALEFGNAA